MAAGQAVSNANMAGGLVVFGGKTQIGTPTTRRGFGSIDTSAFAMAPGAKLDISTPYTRGTLAVVAVPEPATCLSLGAGLVLMGIRLHQRRV